MSLAIDPQNPQTIYAGTFAGGVFKSTNGGISWSPVNSGLTSTYIRSLAIDPQNTQIIYAGSDRGVFKTTNGGTSWSPFKSGLTSTFIYSVAIDPQDTQTVYAGAYGGVFKSTNGAASWNPVNSGLPMDSSTYSLAIDPQNTQTLYAGTRDGGAFKSANGGTSWKSVNSGLTGTWVTSFAMDPQNTQIIYVGAQYGGGVFKSTNGGTNWSQVNSGLTNTDILSLSIDLQNTQTLYAGTRGDGVLKSTNGGTSWNPVNSGLTGNLIIFPVAIDPQNNQTLYAGSYGGGVFKSTNGGTSWSPVNSGLTATKIEVLAIDPQNTQTIFAGSYDNGAFKSTNGGMSWSPVNSGLPSHDVNSLRIDPQNTQTIYAGAGGGGVCKSTNGGTSWSPVNSGLTNTTVLSLAIDPQNTQTIYTGTYYGGVFKSTNGGTTWGPVNSGLTSTFIQSLAIDPQDTQTIYAGSGGGVFKTTNGGEPSAAPSAPTGLTATPTSSNQIVLGWTDTSDNETGFMIERKTGNCASTNAWVQIATKGANVTSHANTGLMANKTYAYRIRAYNDAGNSEYSACTSAKTGVAGTPMAATGLTATSASASKISLKWTDNSKNEIGFKIYRKKDSDPWTLLFKTGINVKKYDDTSAFGNDATASYRYYVTACNGVGCSPPTSTAIVPFKPTATKATSSAGKINLKWTEKSSDETGFQVYRKAGTCASTNSWELIATTAANVHAYSDSDVTAGIPYAYKVRAFAQSGALPYATGFSLYTICVSATAAQGTYSLLDLAGTWRLSALGSESDTPHWRRGNLSVDTSGNFSISQTYPDGSTRNDSGIMSIAKDGTIAIDGLPNMSASMDSGKSILGFTDSWQDGGIEMGILTKNAASYSLADLAGTWHGYGFASYLDAPWWEEATATIKEDGTFTASTADSDGSKGQKSGTFSISSDGVVSIQGESVMKGFIDAGKTLQVWTDTWTNHGGTPEMKVLTKRASSYSMADLAGVWEGNGLVLGDGAPLWERFTATIDSNGNFTGPHVKSNGSEDTESGVMSISQNGTITCPNDPQAQGSMDAGKTVFILISPRDDETTAFYVFTKKIK